MIVALLFGGLVFVLFWSLLPFALGAIARRLYEKTERPRR